MRACWGGRTGHVCAQESHQNVLTSARLIRRDLRRYTRDKSLVCLNLGCSLLTGLILGLVYQDLPQDMEGVVFIDRSGSLFRHVLNFLRDGVLPINSATLKDLYREAKYFELNSLRTEIEKRLGIVSVAGSASRSIDQSSMRLTRGRPIDGRSRWLAPGTPGGIDSFESAMEGRSWWEKPEGHKGYWPSNRKGENKMDWWTGNTYKGKNMEAPLRQYEDITNTLNRSAPMRNSPKKGTTSTWDSRPSYAASMDFSNAGVAGFANKSAVSRFR